MSRPPRARERVLDAYESIVIRDGERAATMDAVAHEAGVSKGGLLYHYASKAALEDALVARLRAASLQDRDEIMSSPEGVLEAFLRSSTDVDSGFDRVMLAVTRLAHQGHEGARDALAGVRDLWEELLAPYVRDDTALTMVLLISDGLYINASLGDDALTRTPDDETSMRAFIARVIQSVARDDT